MPPPFRKKPPLGPRKATPQERILANWRGVDLAPVAKARALTARHASELIPQVLSSIRIDRRQSETEIVKVWNETMSPQVVAHAQPTGLRRGTLFVSVDSNTWLSELARYQRGEILERLRHSFGRDLIQRISFRVG